MWRAAAHAGACGDAPGARRPLCDVDGAVHGRVAEVAGPDRGLCHACSRALRLRCTAAAALGAAPAPAPGEPGRACAALDGRLSPLATNQGLLGGRRPPVRAACGGKPGSWSLAPRSAGACAWERCYLLKGLQPRVFLGPGGSPDLWCGHNVLLWRFSGQCLILGRRRPTYKAEGSRDPGAKATAGRRQQPGGRCMLRAAPRPGRLVCCWRPLLAAGCPPRSCAGKRGRT